MYIVFVVVAAVVVFAVAAAAVGRGDGLEEPLVDLQRPYLPDGRLEPVDIDDVHFAVAFRGYRMEQVDAVLDRLAEELARRDQQISRLERIVHVQTVQSATAYTAPRNHRTGLDIARPRLGTDTGPLPPVPPEQPAGAPHPADPAAEAQPGGPAASGEPDAPPRNSSPDEPPR